MSQLDLQPARDSIAGLRKVAESYDKTGRRNMATAHRLLAKQTEDLIAEVERLREHVKVLRAGGSVAPDIHA